MELRIFAGGHGVAAIQQDAHRDARLNLKHLQEQLLQTKISAPVYRPQIVAMVELPVIQKLLAGPSEMRDVAPADQAGKRFLPTDSQPLELFEERAIDQRRGVHLTAAVLTLAMIL